MVIHLLRCLTAAVKDTDFEGSVIMALVMVMITVLCGSALCDTMYFNHLKSY